MSRLHKNILQLNTCFCVILLSYTPFFDFQIKAMYYILTKKINNLMISTQEIIPFIKFLAGESAGIIKNYYRVPVDIETKADNSPVTIADKKTEEFLREAILKEFPDHGLLGEEFGEINPGAEYKWVLDPIDGTKSFISGTPLFGTLIALLRNGIPLLGAINLPILNELMIGDGTVTILNDKPVKVRGCGNIAEATLLTTDLKSFGVKSEKGLQKLATKVKLLRGWGDCYGYYLIASGFADIMIDPVMSVWDTMALIPVIRGAGGVITDMQGNDPVTGTSIIASSGRIHQEALQILNEGM
jgi:histidinol phosphatase-like enzyme (inositol monophosphatase family)